MPDLLIVEDDADLREALAECLSLQGFRVRAVGTAMDLYQALAARPAGVVILDIGLPDLDGHSVATFLRQNTRIGIIAISANGALEQRLKGLESGADLFFAKPFDCRELGAAARNLAQRLAAAAPARSSAGSAARPAWLVDSAHWSVISPRGRAVRLSAKELQLLMHLCRRPGVVAPRTDLRAELGYAADGTDDRALDALVRRLRVRLEGEGEVAPIQTVRGGGYLFSAGVTVQ